MDAKEEQKGTPLPFQRHTCTRWLVRGKVIYNILLNWEELKAYFAVAVPRADTSYHYKAREILGMLEDPVNLLYFHCVTNHADPEELVSELVLHHKSLQDRILDRNGKPLPLNMVDYGAKFMHELYTFINQQNQSAEAVGKVDEVKKRCAGLLIKALKLVERRLPASTGIFKGLSVFAPCKLLSQTEQVPFKDLPLPHLPNEKEDTIEQQYRKILHLSWAEKSVFYGKIPTDSLSFWSGVLQYKNSTGKRPFEELGTYAMAYLKTPTSNAVLETIFSTVTNVKTNSRNRLGSEMLDAIIRVRSHFQFQGKCCRDFKVTPHMMELFKSANMYEEEEPGDDDRLDVLAYVNQCCQVPPPLSCSTTISD
ncbi:hypothetical protein Hamer_G000820, partial [Homarus americanus]